MKLCIVVYTPESLYEGIRYFESALNLQIYYTLLKKKKLDGFPSLLLNGFFLVC